MIKLKSKSHFLCIGFMLLATILSCDKASEADYVVIENSPVKVELDKVPYAKLSDYNFFKDNLKDQNPSLGVLPYKPTSELFSDYAQKNRFIWLPKDTKASYINDHENLNLPVGAALIKTFYYTNVQPSNTTRIIETRVMIRKEAGWIFAEYVWNDAQTEAVLQLEGSTTAISWKDADNNIQSIDYKIPSENACATCHYKDSNVLPIGIKPQNLNSNITYPEGNKNQLQKLIEVGYLENGLPINITSVVDYNDNSKNIDTRVRSYFDINCAHCHQDGGSADYVTQLRLAFNKTVNPSNMGVCIAGLSPIPGINRSRLVTPNNIVESSLYFSMNTNLSIYRMPRLGRTILHKEGLQLVQQWINSLEECQ